MKSIFYLILFVANFSFCQTKFLEVDLSDIKSKWNIKDAYIVKGKTSKDYFVFLDDKKGMNAFKFDQYKTLEKHIISDDLKGKYKEIIGHIIQDNQLLLLQKNNKGNKFAYIKYNFETQETEEIEYKIDDKSDIFIESFMAKDRFILYTINTFNDKLKKWEFYIDGSYKVKEINMEKVFSEAEVPFKNLGLFLLDSQGFSTKPNLVKVNNNIPNNLEIASEKNKMYEHEGDFIWTIDNYLNYTLIFKFNSPDYNPVLKAIKKPKLKKPSGKSNSFVFDDKIAQIVSNKNELKIDIKLLNDPSQIIKSFHVENDDKIDFKNSPILQEGSTYSFGSTREMEKTSKLLRKMSSENNGISIYKSNNKYHVTIGGTSTLSGGGVMRGFGAPLNGQFGSMTLTYNPTLYAYGMNTSTGSTRIKCLFDTEFNHISGRVKENVFDKIDRYRKTMYNPKPEIISYIDGAVIYGHWDSKNEKYIFRKFD